MIKQAIIPLAGLGTRLLPLTSIFAKELLPINGKPGIEYILDECADAGIKKIVFIISKKKQMIKDYFFNSCFNTFIQYILYAWLTIYWQKLFSKYTRKR